MLKLVSETSDVSLVLWMLDLSFLVLLLLLLVPVFGIRISQLDGQIGTDSLFEWWDLRFGE